MRFFFVRPCIIAGTILWTLTTMSARASELDHPVRGFLQQNCFDCHDADIKKGGLDLTTLDTNLSVPESFATWLKIHDRLRAGEMPPKDEPRPDPAALEKTIGWAAGNLRRVDLERQAKEGRVQFRRLNRVEYENTLRDLLAVPELEVKDMLPADGEAHGFDNVGSALAISYVQMNRYLEAADEALDKAMSLAPRPETTRQRVPASESGRMSILLGRETVAIGDAIGLLRQPTPGQAPWTWKPFEPAIAGHYRVRMKTFGFVWDRGEVKQADRQHTISFYARAGFDRRLLGSHDIPGTQAAAAVVDFTAFLKPSEVIELYLATLDGRRPKPANVKFSEHTAPGVAVEWLEAEGPLIDTWPSAGHRILFGDLPIERWTPESGLQAPRAPVRVVGGAKRSAKRPDESAPRYMVVSREPLRDAARLLHGFGGRMFRRPVTPAEVEPYFALVRDRLAAKLTFHEAMCVGYKAMLCSPEFLFFQERPGRLDDYAMASRLSYFLWSAAPDEALLTRARERTLHQPEVLRAEVERLLRDPRSRSFVENFAGQWLDLRRLNLTEPDEQLYPEYDQLLQDSMLAETHAFFTEMLQRDLGVRHVVDSDFAMINGRLAQLYGIPGIEGVDIRKVSLPPHSPRGGLLTQASVLKVTANGTTTSPVIRGAWVMSRIVGQPLPPPPPNTPAIEPDVRGATTIREQLEKHRSVKSCASCHTKMDPPGFALENFDVIGGWRDRYRALEKGDPVDATARGRPVRYKLGLPVDASGEAPDGRRFRNIDEFRSILLGNEEQLARNLAEKLLVYATGAGIQFADRATVETILAQAKSSGYGLRSLVHAVVQSEAFQIK